VFDAILEKATRLCGANFSALAIHKSDDMHEIVATRGMPPEFVNMFQGPVRLGPETGVSRLVRGESFVHIADASDDEGYRLGNPVRRALVDIAGARSYLAVPISRDGVMLGSFTIYRREVRPFSGELIALLQSFAAQAGIAIENARLFNETQEALERQTATADILRVIASSPSDVKPVFEAIAARAKSLIGGFSSTVFRFIDGVAHLEAFTPTSPEADDILRSTFPRPAKDFAPFRMTQAGEVMQIPDTEALTDEILDISRARGFRSMVFAPLMNKGVSIGFIAVTRIQPGDFTDHHVQLLRTFADQAVIAIQNVRLFDEVQTRTIELSEALEQQTATAEVLGVISSSAGDLAPVFDAMLGKAMQLCSADFGVLNTYDRKAFHTAATYALPPAYD